MSDENNHVNVSPEIPGETTPPRQFWGMNLNTYCMLMNLIQILPGWGQIAAILMWVMNKDNSPEIDRYGKSVANWIISYVIFIIAAGIVNFGIAMLGVVLTFMYGLPLFLIGQLSIGISVIVVIIVGLIFPIIAAVKANDGILWKYPFSYTFFK